MENKLALLLKNTNTKAAQLCLLSSLEKSFVSKYCNQRNLQSTSIHYNTIKIFFEKHKLEETCSFLKCNKKDFSSAFDFFFNDDLSNKSFLKITNYDVYFLISNFNQFKQLFNNSFELFAEYIKKLLVKQTVYLYFIPANDVFLSYFILYFSRDILARKIHLVQVQSTITFNLIYLKSSTIFYQHFYKGKSLLIKKDCLLTKEKSMIIQFLDDLYYTGKYLFNQIKAHLSPLLTNDIVNNLTTSDVSFFVSHPHYSCMSISLLQEVLLSNLIGPSLQEKLNSIIETKNFASKLTVFCSKKEFIDVLDSQEIVCDGISMYTGKKIIFSTKQYLTYLQELLIKLKKKEIKLFFLEQDFPVYYTLFDNLLIIYPKYFNSFNSILYSTNKDDIRSLLHHTTKIIKKENTLEESIFFVETTLYNYKKLHNL